MRRALLCVAAFSHALLALTANAQVTSFPYEAVVETDGTPVHSGPGFYATNRLKRGEHVVVQRHDPGGWYMITPPPGEFSLVSSSAIRDLGNGNAEIIAAETSARVGSRVGKDFGVEQIPLTEGDRVKLMPGVATPAGWTAIQPPRGEYRWISGRFVVPVLPNARDEHDADPYAVPSLAKRPESFNEAYVEYESLKPAASSAGPSLSLEAPEVISSPKTETASQLRNLDRQLEGLSLSEPTDWPLDKLTIDYKRLKIDAPAMARQIDVRLAQIAKLRLVKTHYTDYVQLTSATDERDALLLASGQAVASPVTLAQPVSTPAVSMASEPRRLAMPPSGGINPVPMAPPAEPKEKISGPTLGPPELAAAPSTAPVALQRPQPTIPTPPSAPQQLPGSSAPQPQRFEAVGVVQKAVDPPPTAPKYVLVAPNGRILVYLQEPRGVSFDGFVDQPMGVDGERLKHPEMTTPMIAVEKLTPVRF
ncbi:MAG: hypothetical protein M3552_05530 [Planctomycetota bacterium]|nr:hypothetical protein [Planctomycetota bacterium]